MSQNQPNLENLALEFVRVTELSAIAASKWIGRGDKKLADKAAVDAMRETFNQIDFAGEIVIGEGAKDESYELYIGEKVGQGKKPILDIAVDPLECTSSVAFGRPNALTVISAGPKDSLYKAIDSYMEKLAVGPKAAKAIDLKHPLVDNLKSISKALDKKIEDLTVAILDRPRQEELIKQVREIGAKVYLFTDGDIAMAIATCLPESPIDVLVGTGGSTEAVLAASALKTLGGNMFTRWNPQNETSRKRLEEANITDFQKIYTLEDLAKGNNLIFVATGVITGPLLEGVVMESEKIITHSIIMLTQPKVVRFIKTNYSLK